MGKNSAKRERASIGKIKLAAKMMMIGHSIEGKERPTKCFVCLEGPSLKLRERVTSYATPSSLSRQKA